MTSQKLGLLMIGGALLAIASMWAVLSLDARERRANEIHADGVALVRLLGGAGWEALVPGAGGVSALEALRARVGRSALAYALVQDERGAVRARVGPIDLLPADAAQPGAVQNWLGEREIRTADGREVLEFSMPVSRGDALAGQVRVGFLRPSFVPSPDELPLVAGLALPVFLLIPFIWYGVRREMRPLGDVGRRLDEVARRGFGDGDAVTLEPSADLRAFMANFDRFLKLADERVQDAKVRQQDLLVHQRLLSYEKGRIEAALQSLPDGVVVVDESGQATFMNDNLALMLGIARSDALGTPVTGWAVDEPVQNFFRRFNGGKSLHRVETLEYSPATHPDKRYSVNAFPLFSPKETSEVFGAVAIFRDISAEALARGARDEFVAHVAHEIKSPLNVINMQAETLAEFGAEDAELRVSAVNVIQDEVDRLSRMVRDLLSITQIEAGSVDIDRQPVKLREFLEDVFTTTMRGGEARGIVPRLELPRTLPNVHGDKDLLRLALNNLLTNAIKYNRDGGAVTLCATEIDGGVSIAVSDEGVGIAPEELSRVFDKFYRSPSAEASDREGHGLGLALTKQVIDLHHGALRVESEPGEGTTFTVTLKTDAVMLREAV